MGWANRITLGRGVLTLVLWGMLIAASDGGSSALWWTAFALFVVAAGTDYVDGIVARHLDEVTVFGRVVDPLIDKLLTIGALVLLLGVPATRAALPAWAVALILAREMLVTTLRSVLEGRGRNFQAVAWGKYKMVLQCVAVGALLLHPLGIEAISGEVGLLAGVPAPAAGGWTPPLLLVLAATALTVVSGVAYVARAVAVGRAPPEGPPPR